MDPEQLATIEGDGRLVLTGAQHDLGWLTQDEGELAVRIPCRGCLYLKPLRTIAEAAGSSEAEAKAQLNSLGSSDASPYGLSSVCWGGFVRRKGRGTPVYRISLPPKALWALFGMRDRPLRTPKGGRGSARVLVRAQSGGLVVWSHRGWPVLRADLELEDFGI